MLIKQLFWAVLLTAALSAPASAATLYLSVAASMTDAFTDIIASFAKSYPDVRVLPNFASSGALAKQIAQGTPADLYVSANTKWMQYLMDNNLVDESTNIRSFRTCSGCSVNFRFPCCSSATISRKCG
jgi:molybdate transport system substrate-binding protein